MKKFLTLLLTAAMTLSLAACGDEGQNVGQRAVFVLMRKRDLRVPAAYVVHFLAHELNASRKFGHNGNKGRFQLFRRNLRHA